MKKTPRELLDFPRLAELHSEFTWDSESNFFIHLPRRLREDETTQLHYKTIEHWMSHIPERAWTRYKDKVARSMNIRHPIRHWEKLHDTFNEAFGAFLLRSKYDCREIELVPEAKLPSPDWFGMGDSKKIYCEVKTINHSDEEQKSWTDNGTHLPGTEHFTP